jgi:hypothetical protein
MKRKIKVGDFIHYKDYDEEIIGKVTYKSKGERFYGFKSIKYLNRNGEHHKRYYFEVNSPMYKECIVGKTLDELWVRMI